jgi:hypothetical protein
MLQPTGNRPMASGAATPFLRTPLHPILDEWTGEPALRWSMLRFGVWCSWEQKLGGQPIGKVAGIALIAPELPVSVVPLLVRMQSHIVTASGPPVGWQSRSRLLWRGLHAPVGQAIIRLGNELDPQNPVDLSLPVLLPTSDPPGPPARFALLGMDFFNHYNVRVTLDYPGIVYRPDPVSGRPDPDPFSRCGSIEIF